VTDIELFAVVSIATAFAVMALVLVWE